MNADARARFVSFLIACGEGRLTNLYLDRKCIATTGVGNALFTVGAALSLEWTHGDGGPPADADDVRAAWNAVHARTDLAGHGGSAFAGVSDLRATPASIDALIDRDIADSEAILVQSFPTYYDAPDNAQEAVMRLRWAMGPHFAEGGRWPKLRAAFAAGDWATCAQQCRIPELDVDEPKANELEAALFESIPTTDDEGS